MKQQKVMRTIVYALVLFVLFTGISIEGSAAKRKKTKKVQKTENAYEKLFKGKQVHTSKGMMTVHVMEGNVFVEFPLSLLGKDMLLTSSIQKTSDHGEGVVGEFAGKPLHMVFTKNDSILEARLILQNRLVNRIGEQAVEEAIEEANTGGIYQSFKIVAPTPDSSAVVVDMTSLFLEDSYYSSPFPGYAANSLYGLVTREHEFDEERSFLRDAHAYQNSIIVGCEMSYDVDYMFFGAMVMNQDVPVTVLVDKILMLLPETPMQARLADPRIGTSYYTGAVLENAKTGLKKVFYSNRWRIEPVDPVAYASGELVEPQKPIVFYLDTLMPQTWKKYIRSGAEEWNLAFEKIGFKDVVRVLEFPQNDSIFNANDLNYSTIRYAPLTLDEILTSMHTDPRTGEILNASIYISDNVRYALYLSRVLSTMATDPSVRQAVLAEEVMGDLIRTSIMQSVGECLGLTSNFGASYAYPVDSLRSASFTQQYGLSASIMDDIAYNYIAQPEDVKNGVRLTPKGLGPYDYYAIKWLYCPIKGTTTPESEFATLDKWIKEVAEDPMFRYKKRQYTSTVYDPTALYGDLGNDHLKATDYYIRNLKRALQHYHEWYKEGDRDLELRGLLYDNLVFTFKNSMNNVMAYIGGIYLNEICEGDKGTTYQVESKERQKEALKYVIDVAKDLSWLDNGDLKYLYNLKDLVPEAAQEELIGLLFNRVSYVALGAEKSLEAYTPQEYLSDLYRIIWDKTLKNQKLTKTDMNLQNLFVANIMATSSITGPALNFLPASEDDALALSSRSQYLNEFVQKSFSNYAISKIVLKHSAREEGFEPMSKVKIKDNTTAYLFYDMLLEVKELLSSAITQSSGDTRSHYNYLLYRIDKALKNKD